MEQSSFIFACHKGDLQTAQNLKQNHPNIIISFRLFLSACENGHLELAQWLLQMNPNIDVHVNNNWAFRKACNYGHFDVAQWLLQIRPDIIHHYNVWIDAFLSCCTQNNRRNLQVAQWMYQLKPILKNSMFIEACENDSVSIAYWLHSLNPFKFNLTIQDYCIDKWNVNNKDAQLFILYASIYNGYYCQLVPSIVTKFV